MLTPEQRSTVASVVNTQRIILLALIAGPASYIAFVLTRGGEPRDNDVSNMPVMAAAFAVLPVIAAIVLPFVMASQQRSAMAAGKGRAAMTAEGGDQTTWLLSGLQVRTIIRAALLEGAAFFNIFAFQTDRQPYSLAIAVALLLGILATWPFRGRTEEWLEGELRFQRDAEQLRGETASSR